MSNEVVLLGQHARDAQLAQLAQPRVAPLRVVLSSVSSDSHTWNLVFLQLLLEHMGHEVHNIGACAPDDLIVQTCVQEKPDLLIISTVNGHGNIDGERLIRRVREEALLRGLPVAIGGKLGVLGAGNAAHVDGLLAAGFTAVFDASAGGSAPAHFEGFVRQISAGATRPTLTEATP